MKRYLTAWGLIVFVTIGLIASAHARRLKIYRVPKQIAPGQMGILIFENPTPDRPVSVNNCTAPKYIGWTKSDIPILRIEQNGKQVWTSLGAYQSIGDSCIATFMAPPTLVAEPAMLYLVNGSDPSAPAQLHVDLKVAVEMPAIEGAGVAPLGSIRIIGDGFVPEVFNARKKIMDELEANVGLSKMPKAEQWVTLDHRIRRDWEQLPSGDYLLITQGAKTWQAFAEECGVSRSGMTMDFTAPPDLQPGAARLTLVTKLNGAEAARSAPLTVTVR